MEDRTRKNNLRFAGFSESGKESWDESEKKLKDFIQNKLGVKHNVTIGRAHRTGKINIEDGTANKKRTIVVTFLRHKDKESILTKHKEDQIRNQGEFINEDFFAESTDIQNHQFQGAKDLHEQGNYGN